MCLPLLKRDPVIPFLTGFNNVIYRFGIRKRTFPTMALLVNSCVRQPCDEYGIDHIRSSPYYPQENCQVKANNKTLIRILRIMV